MAPSNIHPCLLLLLVAFFTIAFNYGQAACVTKSTTPSPAAHPPLRSAFRTRKFAASAPAGGHQQEAPGQSPFSRTHPMDMSSSPPPEACPPEASSPLAFPPDASSPEVSPPETYSSSATSLLLDTSAVTSSSLSAASMSSNIASSAPEASAPGTPTPGASAPETSSDTLPAAASHDDASAPTHPATSSIPDTSSAPGTSALDTPSTGTGGTTGISGDPGLKRICDATDNPQLCLVTISPFLSAGTGKADPMTVLRMAIKACMENARLALSTARTFTVGLHVAGDKDTASSLDTCSENYSDALDNLDSALGAIEANDMGTMNSMLSAVVTDFGSCTDAFAESGASSPLASFDDKLAKMASNSLAIVSLIKQ